VGAGNLGFSPRGEAILRTMAEVGYDAMAMGNRESHPTSLMLAQKLKGATFPVLSANLVVKRASPPAVVRPYVLLEGGGVRVAVFGLTPQVVRPGSAWARVTDFVWEEPIATAARVAAELRQQADLVVCLSHVGYRADGAIAEIAEIDLVLGGHSHREAVEQESGQAMVVHAGAYGRFVSRVHLTGRGEVRAELIELESEP
jgi:2',3'-cyclic-nucleotide 2'-phosphodiesterase (5'-nucleotidase family)